MDFINETISQNGHWEGGKITIPRTDALVERTAFLQLEKAAGSKFIAVIRGLRRTGKSVLARQLMQKTINQELKPTEVGWFEFDRSMGATYDDLDKLVKFFESRGVKLVVLDEVAFVKGWQDVLKRHYDNSETKFIVTGSSALELDKRSSESLAGR
ncbi:MAG: AAA family ATPase, partial [Candidatus Micrarchaeota archaeon]|nr:AAA family ATPase [Candidatus Micrarchaeota archaeon]